MRRFEVKGLYQATVLLDAEDEADARRIYHEAYPGAVGTVLRVAPQSDPEEELA